MLNMCDQAKLLRAGGRSRRGSLPQPSGPSSAASAVSLQPPAAAPRGSLVGAVLFDYREHLHCDPHGQGLAVHGGGDPRFWEAGTPTVLLSGYTLTGLGTKPPPSG